MQKVLIVVGVVLLAAGLAWPWIRKIPAGRLPGDLRFEGEGWSLSLPLVTCLILSAVLTLVFWLARRGS